MKIFLKSIRMNDFIYFRFLLGLGVLFCLSSCTSPHLNVQTQYLSHENLASYYVGTPDPLIDTPIIGQRLLIQWTLPRTLELNNLHLYLKVRFRNYQEEEMTVPIRKRRGFHLYELINQFYCESGGLLTYKVEMRQGPCVLEVWKHPLWVELITFDFSQNHQNQTNNE